MIKFELVTLSGTKFGDQVHEVLLPTPDGQIAVFTNHAPLVTIAVPGVISIRHKATDPDDMMEHFASHGGVIEVTAHSVRMLVDEADRDSELNEKDIAEALARAKQQRAEAKDPVAIGAAQSLIDQQTVRLKVASLSRRKRRL